MSVRRLLALVGLVALCGLVPMALPAEGVTRPPIPVMYPGDTSAQVVLPVNFPDPGFGRFQTQAAGARWYLYATGMLGSSAATAFGHYTDPASVMPAIPRWVDRREPALWAPQVVQTSTVPGAERFTMYFSGHRRATGLNCLGVALARSPGGPFVSSPQPLTCAPEGYWEAIDPSAYTDAGGHRWVVYKIGDYSPRRFSIVARRVVGPRGARISGAPVPVLTEEQLGGVSAEAPSAVTAPDGSVWLFVARNGYTECNYVTEAWHGPDLFHLARVGYVRGMGSRSGILCGAGGTTALRVGNRMYVAFHTRARRTPLVRYAWVARLGLGDDGAFLR